MLGVCSAPTELLLLWLLGETGVVSSINPVLIPLVHQPSASGHSHILSHPRPYYWITLGWPPKYSSSNSKNTLSDFSGRVYRQISSGHGGYGRRASELEWIKPSRRLCSLQIRWSFGGDVRALGVCLFFISARPLHTFIAGSPSPCVWSDG